MPRHVLLACPVGTHSPYVLFIPPARVASGLRIAVMPGLVGREAELRAVAGFLETLAVGPVTSINQSSGSPVTGIRK